MFSRPTSVTRVIAIANNLRTPPRRKPALHQQVATTPSSRSRGPRREGLEQLLREGR